MPTLASTVRSESHAEIGALIESSADLVLDQWCRRALDAQPAARIAQVSVLRDHFGKLLRAIGCGLCDAYDSGVHRAPAVQHGEQRWESGWSLTELVRDYQLMRLVLLEHLEAMLARPLRHREIMAIGVFIDDAISGSVAAYVQNRDAELVRSQQQHAGLLEETNRRKDEFLAVLGHELRNPLAPIMTSIRVIRGRIGAVHEAVTQSIEVIERQTSQLARLVDDMLDLARIGQGRFELRKSRLALAKMIDEAALAAAPVMKEHGHRLHVAPVDTSIEIDADPDRFLQVVANLLTNAAKYTDAGGDVYLTAERDGSDALVRVRDTGIGIPAEMIPRVFELFMQVDEAQRYAQGGLGIGLALCRRLVEQHGGSIACRSDGAGHGSEFIVRLPLAGRQEADGAEAERAIRIVTRRVETDPSAR
ncbi:MAG TPA: HAMP domain-containing sensor histidine kinase [Burkholderiales bacterium]|nr:HAMP domain-containing sensor histidine kinase [Burkholderiales bacterium]